MNANIYVDAETGDDRDGDGTREKPFGTLRRAVDAVARLPRDPARASATVHVEGGTHPV